MRKSAVIRRCRCAGALASALLIVSACDKPAAGKAAVTSPGSETTPPAESNPAVGDDVWTIAPSGEATFVVEHQPETVRGTIRNTKGQLFIDASDLLKTKGTISVDLFTLRTHTYDDDGKNEDQTLTALTWLEVAADIGDLDKRKAYRWGSFEITKILSATPADLTKVSGAARMAKIHVEGELFLHGQSSTHATEFQTVFTYDDDRPVRVTVTTLEPLEIDLRQHGVQPVDKAGVLVKDIAKALDQKTIAGVAEVTYAFRAMPAPPTAKK